jgi:hypothetical protein
MENIIIRKFKLKLKLSYINILLIYFRSFNTVTGKYSSGKFKGAEPAYCGYVRILRDDNFPDYNVVRFTYGLDDYKKCYIFSAYFNPMAHPTKSNYWG